jgi:adenylate cyclase
VLTIVPKSFFFNTIIHQTWTAVGWALSLCLLCALLAALFFGSISIRLKKIALEMNKIGNFQLSDQLFAQRKSFIREVKLMNEAIDHMKTGLKSFAKYVPLDLVSKLIQSGHPAKIGGEKQHLTLLFSDLAHFTALSEKKNAEELVQILENYFNEMSHVIQAQHGTVDKYMGNGLMAFWGAPLKTHSHALDACRAALLMREKEKKLNNPSTLSLRIGINTGEAIVGNFGSPTRMNYTTIGDAVNLANRLETLNTFYGTCILLGPDTAKAVSSTLLLRPIDHVAVKGKKQVVLIYELLSEKQEASPNTLSAIAAYKEGLDQYVNQKFQDAIRSFEKAKQLFGGKDTPSDAMIHKARHYLEKPPGPGWKGATILTSTELFPNT